MKRRATLCALVLCAVNIHAQIPDWIWVSTGGDSVDNDEAMGTAFDAWGNTLVVGRFEGVMDLGGNILTSQGGQDAFIGKLDPSGAWIWARSFGSPEAEALMGIAVDGDGSAYVTGGHGGTVTLGSETLDVTGQFDLLVAKIDSAGNWLWATHTTGTGQSLGQDVSLDGFGSVYVSGQSDGEEIAGNDTIVAAGAYTPLIARMDGLGNWSWVRTFRTTGDAQGYTVSALGGGGAVLAGGFIDTIYVGVDTLLSGPNGSGYLIKVDDQGAPVWGRRTAGSSATTIRDLAIDQLGRIFLVGYCGIGNAIIGDTTFVVSDIGNGCIARLSAAGTWAWALMTEGAGAEAFTGVALHPLGHVLVSGLFYGGDAVLGNTSLTNLGDGDVIAAAFTPGGAWLLALSAGGAGDDAAYAVATATNGAASVCGSFTDVATFGPYTATAANGSVDAYVGQLAVLGTAVESASSSGYTPWLLQDPAGITVQGLRKGHATLRVFDATGRVVAERNGTAINGSLPLGALDLSAGAFLVRVQQGGQHATLKFVVR